MNWWFTPLPSALITHGGFLLHIGHLHQRDQLGFAGIAAVPDAALKTDHAAVDAVDGVFHGGLARHKGLLDIRLGGQMCAAALQQIQLDATDLGAGLLLQHLRQNGGQTAQLSMAEAVIGGYLGLGDEAAVLIVDALGDGDDAAALSA